MKRLQRLIFGIGACLLASVAAQAQEAGTYSGEASIGYREVEGERESAKFQEYRDLTDGTFGDVEWRYKSPNDYFLDFRAYNIGKEDDFIDLTTGKYGKFKVQLMYNKIPHRFAFDAKTLYAGAGSGNLVLTDLVQSQLQNVGTDNVGDLNGNGTPNEPVDRNIELANRTQEAFTNAFSTDVELFRKIGRINLDLTAFNPVNVRVELMNEQRTGTRPFSGSFGFGNTIEIPEPIDYDTSSAKITAEFATKPFYFNASYYLSIFENHVDTLTWDNPFRAVDGTDLPGPPSVAGYTSTFQTGPSQGLIDLAPNNHYHNVSTTASLSLPLRSRLTASASWGWMRQDDDLKPFTTNTAITAPLAALDPATGQPVGTVDANVDTSLYLVQLTSRPLDFMDVKARYRFYEYDNDTRMIDFPNGYVRVDASLQPGEVENEPSGFKKHTTGLDLGFHVMPRSTFTVGYAYENTKRENREVANQDEHIYSASFDTRILPQMGLKLSYERAERDSGNYDFTVPFGGEIPNAQLPFLRKYEQAGRDRDRVQLIATLNPIDPLTVSASALYWKDDYKADFGLLNDEHQIYSIDADYGIADRANAFAFYSYERVENDQQARQWVPASGTSPAVGDPYTVAPGLESNSNWTARKKDKTHTVGGGFNVAVIPRKVETGVNYSYSMTDGEVALSSPVGVAANDTNAFVPVGFTEVDDITIQTLNARVKYFFNRNLALTLGYLWERYDIEDFGNAGFTFVPVTITGTFNGGILMGIFPQDYDASMVYAKMSYVF